MSGEVRGTAEAIAAEALAEALRARSGGASWRGVVRGLAWRLVVAGDRDPRSIDLLAEAGEARFAALLEEALFAIECVALESYRSFLGLRPGDRDAAWRAARLDASEESAARLDGICARVAAELAGRTRRAA